MIHYNILIKHITAMIRISNNIKYKKIAQEILIDIENGKLVI